MKLYAGIDLGLKGGIAVVDDNERLYYCTPMPVTQIIVNKKKRDQYDINAVLKEIERLKNMHVALYGFERLRPIPMQSSQTGFSLGFATGMIKTMLAHVVTEEIEPRSWQKEMFQGYNYTREQTKVVSIAVASRLFPDFEFKKKDGLSDAALIALYLKRKYE